MIPWKKLVLRSIDNVIIVPSVQGRNHVMSNRPCYGLSFAYGGRITYRLNGIDTVSDSTSAVFLPQGQSYQLFREETGDFPVINFTVSEDFTEEFIRIPITHPERYLTNFERLRSAWINSENPAKAMSIFYEIISQLSEEGEHADSHHILSPAMEYLGRHLSDPELSNTRLAESAGISEVYFRKLFKETYQIPPRQYILQARINHAKELLSERSATVSAISDACGFSSVYHFCRAFKQITGMTPLEYEKKYS
jgi:AraC-like DNA-binding protein